jgi:hypothetical protein
MFGTTLTKFLAVAIPVALALGNCVPSNIFLSIATIAAFFAYYVSSCGKAAEHVSLWWTACVSAVVMVALLPVVIFDSFYFNDDASKSVVAGILSGVVEFTPYLVFFASIGYAIYVVACAGFALLPKKQAKNAR